MNQRASRPLRAQISRFGIVIGIALLACASAPAQTFSAGNLVVTVEGNGVNSATSGPYTDNQAGPLTLFQYTPNGTTSLATYVGAFVLPQTASGANFRGATEPESESPLSVVSHELPASPDFLM